MKNRSGKAAVSIIVVIILAVAAYWYWSPFLALRNMQAAAVKHDAAAFNTYVNYPQLRDNLKVQLASRVNEKMAHASHGGNLLGAFGQMLGTTMVDTLVDAMVRPDIVMRGMASGQFGPQRAAAGPSGAAKVPAKQDAKPAWSYVREGADTLIVYPESSTAPPGQRLNIVFVRSGFANWQLTDVRMPSAQP
jgi:hypothetical protein